MEAHDLHDFVVSSQRTIEEQYARIQKRALEDPGTAGDQGENNWAELLRAWLPSRFEVVTKGRLLTESGYASPQIDVIVLSPSYPPLLRNEKLYLSAGVAAAFECKITLKAEHIKSAVETSVELRRNLLKRKGTPYCELNSSIIYGLLSHSHSWKQPNSEPLENVERVLWEADEAFVKHPIECLDLICVSDLATWNVNKITCLGKEGSPVTAYPCGAIGTEIQEQFFSPLGILLSVLYSKLAWIFPDMRPLEEYFRKVNLRGSGRGKMRKWDMSIYSDSVQGRVRRGTLASGISYDEWSLLFF